MAIVVVLAILFSCILLILCLPITYALTVHIGTPFQVEGQGSWGRKLADASWSYSLGEEPHHELHTCWRSEAEGCTLPTLLTLGHLP